MFLFWSGRKARWVILLFVARSMNDKSKTRIHVYALHRGIAWRQISGCNEGVYLILSKFFFQKWILFILLQKVDSYPIILSWKIFSGILLILLKCISINTAHFESPLNITREINFFQFILYIFLFFILIIYPIFFNNLYFH